MNNRLGELTDSTGRVAEILDDFLRQAAAGAAPSQQALLAEHPDLAEALGACLASLDWIHHAGLEQPAAIARDTADASDTGTGKTLGDFRLLRQIGRGGMGVVYEAEQRSLGRRVALKILPFAGMLDPRQRQRFLNEAHAAAQLDHPNIINVIGVGCERGVYYYAMRLVEGPTLADVVRQLRETRGARHRFPEVVAELAACAPSPADDEDTTLTRPPTTPRDGAGHSRLSLCESSAAFAERKATMACQPDTPHDAGGAHATDQARGDSSTCASRPGAGFYRCVAQVGIQIARALNYAHELGVVHRDIKPSNLMVDCHGTVWVTDFGLARVETDPELTMTGDLLGTLRYMSPEQITGRRSAIDHRTDLYSLGATLYELICWRPAFAADERAELLRRIAADPPVAPRKLNKSAPAELETIVLKALEKNPLDRYPTAGEMADDLQRFLDNRPIRARRSRVLGHLKAFWRRHQVLLVAVLLTLLVASSIGSLLVWRQRQEAVAQRALVVARDADLRQRLYAADIKLAHQAWQRGDLVRMKELLDRYSGPAGDELRDFAWHYLSSLLAARPAPLQVLRPGDGNIYCVQFSPDGKHLAAACGDGHVVIWTVPDLSPRHVLAAHQADADCVAFSSDGKLLVSGGEDGWLRLWDVETGELRRSLEAGQKDTLTVAISPDGQTLAAGGIDGLVRLWRLPGGELRDSFRASSGRVQHLAFSPDGKKLATAGGDARATVFDALTGTQSVPLPSLSQAVYSVAFSTSGDELALASATGLVALVDPYQGSVNALLGVRPSQVRAVAMSPARGLLASAGQSGVVDVWDRTGRSLSAKLYGHERRIWSLCFSPDGDLLASGGDDGSLHVWNPNLSPGMVHAEHEQPIYDVRFAPDSNRLQTATDKQELVAWEVATLKRQAALPLPAAETHEISFAPHRRTFAVRTRRGEIWLGDSTGGPLTQFAPGLIMPVQKVALASNDRLLLWYADDTLEVRNAATTTLLDRRQLAGHPSSWPAVSSRDGRLVAVGWHTAVVENDSVIFLYDVETLTFRLFRRGKPPELYAVALSPDNRWLAAAWADASIGFFDITTGEHAFSLTGHQHSVDCLAFSPEGQTLASAGRGGAVRLWHLATREELFVVERLDSGGRTNIDFSPDGRRLVAATGDRRGKGHIFVWPETSQVVP
ncbi:MAG TPA: protein kinase [Pirellulales bacterium]